MAVTASDVFDFLGEQGKCIISRCEIFHEQVSKLRTSMRFIIFSLSQSEESVAKQLVYTLRSVLYEMLTVPVPFDKEFLERIELLGTIDWVTARWGRDVGDRYDQAVQIAKGLSGTINPVRAELIETIKMCQLIEKRFKIFCHRAAIEDFESLATEGNLQPLGRSAFICTTTDYRDVRPADVLIKVGPLRQKGYGAVPDAILTAPRFSELVQLVWSGCNDEQGFGYDPTDDNARIGSLSRRSPVRRIGYGGDFPVGKVDEDEFDVLRNVVRIPDKRMATLLQIDEEHGILFPPHSQVISYCPHAVQKFQLRRNEALTAGYFIVIPITQGEDFGPNNAEHGEFSLIWKTRLLEEYRRDPEDLIFRLKLRGLNLSWLRSALRNWCREPTTVIHAPQLRPHFKILIEVLERDSELERPAGMRNTPWWEQAWVEIARSRGEAIQAGFQEQDAFIQAVIADLNEVRAEIGQLVHHGTGFVHYLPGSDVKLRFEPVISIESGFLVPDKMLRRVVELREAEQWRE